MTTVTVPATRVRVPPDVREAVERRDPVTVTDRERSAYVILHPDEYALVQPILEQHRRGRPIPIEQLLTDEDYAVMAVDDAGEQDALALGILESWND